MIDCRLVCLVCLSLCSGFFWKSEKVFAEEEISEERVYLNENEDNRLQDTSEQRENNKVVEESSDQDENDLVGYAKATEGVFRYLAYRDIPDLIKKYVKGKKALDYGCGMGVSTQFLIGQELSVNGVDSNKDMIGRARIYAPQAKFKLVRRKKLPFRDNSYDMVFSSFVLFEMSSQEKIVHYLKEGARVLNEEGILIAVTSNEELYKRNWFIFDNNYPENYRVKSGGLARVYICDSRMEIIEYYWTVENYREAFQQAGLEIIEEHYPLGRLEEPYPWLAEKDVSPFVVFVARKLPVVQPSQ